MQRWHVELEIEDTFDDIKNLSRREILEVLAFDTPEYVQVRIKELKLIND